MIATRRQEACALARRSVIEMVLGSYVLAAEVTLRLVTEAEDLLLAGFEDDELMVTGSDEEVLTRGDGCEVLRALDWHVHPEIFG